MLYLLLYPLRDYFGPLNLFRYITFRAAYAAALSIVLVLVLGPPVVRWIRRQALGQNIRDEVPDRHRAKAGTPTMGGLLIVGSILISILLLGDLANRNIQLGLLVLVWLGVLGFIDDYCKVRRGQPRGLAKRTKLIWQFLLALVVGGILYFLPTEPAYRSATNLLVVKNIVMDVGIFYIPLVAVVLVGASNTVNLADGLDGLAIGLLAIAYAAYAALAYVAGNAVIAGYLQIIFLRSGGELAVLAAAALGAGLGFLWFNSYPASVFMGDTGSLPLGGTLGLLAVLTKQEFLLILIGGVFVLEGLSVLAQIVYFRVTGGGRLLRMAPLHHHFELVGWSEPKIVTRFWIIAILLTLVALSTLKIR